METAVCLSPLELRFFFLAFCLIKGRGWRELPRCSPYLHVICVSLCSILRLPLVKAARLAVSSGGGVAVVVGFHSSARLWAGVRELAVRVKVSARGLSKKKEGSRIGKVGQKWRADPGSCDPSDSDIRAAEMSDTCSLDRLTRRGSYSSFICHRVGGQASLLANVPELWPTRDMSEKTRSSVLCRVSDESFLTRT